MNLYITGGHLTPALSVIELIQKKQPDIKLFFVGREYAQTLTRQPSHEEREVSEHGIPFLPIDAAKVHRAHFWLNFQELVKLPHSFWQVYKLFSKARPQVVLSFGGYVAFPVCVLGKIYGARVIIHEQTKAAGLANQLIAFIADKIAIASPESLVFFPKEKTIVTGNPIRESLLREYKVPPTWLPKLSAQIPLIYITGGSQGSQIINQTIATLLSKLLVSFVIVHQCGPSNDHISLQELEVIRSGLPEALQERYLVREWIDAKEVSYLMRNSKFVITRAGANTVQELTLAGTPAIYIPLAFAYNNEQEKNARSLTDAGAGILLLQKDLLPETLYAAIQTMNRRYDTLKKRSEALSSEVVKNGASRVLELVLAK